MSRADVLVLVQLLSPGLADPIVCNGLYDETVEMLAASTEHLVRSDLLPVNAQQATFQLQDDMIGLLHVAFGGRQLSLAMAKELEALTPAWRDKVGPPTSYIEETEADRVFRVYPKPIAPSGAFSFPHGTPMGDDYPTDAVHVLTTDRRDDLPVILELPVALLILEREYTRASNHSNQLMGKICGDFGRLLLQLMI
jgi:hypothetical protein